MQRNLYTHVVYLFGYKAGSKSINSDRRNTHLYYANSVDPDQVPYFAAFDMGLHCLPTSHFWVYTAV